MSISSFRRLSASVLLTVGLVAGGSTVASAGSTPAPATVERDRAPEGRHRTGGQGAPGGADPRRHRRRARRRQLLRLGDPVVGEGVPADQGPADHRRRRRRRPPPPSGWRRPRRRPAAPAAASNGSLARGRVATPCAGCSSRSPPPASPWPAVSTASSVRPRRPPSRRSNRPGAWRHRRRRRRHRSAPCRAAAASAPRAAASPPGAVALTGLRLGHRSPSVVAAAAGAHQPRLLDPPRGQRHLRHRHPERRHATAAAQRRRRHAASSTPRAPPCWPVCRAAAPAPAAATAAPAAAPRRPGFADLRRARPARRRPPAGADQRRHRRARRRRRRLRLGDRGGGHGLPAGQGPAGVRQGRRGHRRRPRPDAPALRRRRPGRDRAARGQAGAGPVLLRRHVERAPAATAGSTSASTSAPRRATPCTPPSAGTVSQVYSEASDAARRQRPQDRAAPTAPTSSTPTCSTWPPEIAVGAPVTAGQVVGCVGKHRQRRRAPPPLRGPPAAAGRRSTPTPSSRRSAPADEVGPHDE